MLTKSSRKISYNVACLVEDQQETLYTCPANCRSEMSLLFISNADGNTDVEVEFIRANGDHVHIIGGKNILGGDYLQFSDAVLVFEPGDSMKVTPSGNTTPHIDAICTVEEIFKPVG